MTHSTNAELAIAVFEAHLRQEQRNERLRHCLERPVDHIVEIGDLLAESRDALPPGTFLPWLATAYPECSPAQAFDYIMVSETLAAFPQISSVSPQILYARARTSTPEELRHFLMRHASRDHLSVR